MRTVITALVLAVVVGVGFMNMQTVYPLSIDSEDYALMSGPQERQSITYLYNLERTSRYQIQNMNDHDVNSAHEFYAYGSGLVASINLVVPANSSIVVNCSSINDLPSVFSGYVLIITDGPITATLLPTYKAYLPVIGYEGIQ